MKRKAEVELSLRKRRKEYRDEYQQRMEERWKDLKKVPVPERDFVIVDELVKPINLDMTSFSGTEEEFADAVEAMYTNDGRHVIHD